MTQGPHPQPPHHSLSPPLATSPRPAVSTSRPPRPPVTFGSAIGSGFRKYFDVSSRASRKEFWLFVLFSDAVLFGLLFLTPVWEVFARLALLSYLGMLIPLFTAGVRRLHDIGRTGHWSWVGLLPLGPLVLLVLWTRPSQPHANRYGP